MKGLAALFHAAEGRHRYARAADRCALESGHEALPISGSHVRTFPARVTIRARCEVAATMSAVPPGTGNRASKTPRESSPVKGLRGLIPYLRRYPGGIVFGLLTVVLMSIVGNALPLATGVMTDTLAGNSVRSEEHTSELQSRLHLVCRLLLEKKKLT